MILIVDDERPIRTLVGRWLEAAGYPYREASNAEDALEAMAAEPASVVFCDLEMPGNDGVWLTRKIRIQYPTTAVVLATGWPVAPPSVTTMEGVLSYVLKPFRREALMEALEKALRWHEEARQSGVPIPDPVGLERWLTALAGG